MFIPEKCIFGKKKAGTIILDKPAEILIQTVAHPKCAWFLAH
jgi:hypothetical protein